MSEVLDLKRDVTKAIETILQGWKLGINDNNINNYLTLGNSDGIFSSAWDESKINIMKEIHSKSSSLQINSEQKNFTDKNKLGEQLAPYILKRRSAFLYALFVLKNKVQQLETDLIKSKESCTSSDTKVKELIDIINAMLQYHSEDTELKIVNAV